MAQFEFKCPQCGESIEADDSLSGQAVECPYCGKGIVVFRGNAQTGISQGKEFLSPNIRAEESGQKGITTKCPYCGTMYEVEHDYFGRKVLCETCGRNFVVVGIESAHVASDSDITMQKSAENRTDDKESAKTFAKVKSLVTIATARTVTWWKNGKEEREAFCSKVKTAAITAKNKFVTLWKSGTKGKVFLGFIVLFVLCLILCVSLGGNRMKKQNDTGVYGIQHHLGEMQDAEKKVKDLRTAAELNNATAQFSLGVCYIKGVGVPQDYTEAVRLFRLSAEQGNDNAQKNLGVLYCLGYGIPKDTKEGIQWLKKARDLGNEDARELLDEIFK
jgi:DNA-directed RNA polymerase subunit RPC12/RpoP